MAECLIHSFLDKYVLVEVDGCQIPGKLLSYQEGQSIKPHRPDILVLETQLGKVLIRGNWHSIGSIDQKEMKA